MTCFYKKIIPLFACLVASCFSCSHVSNPDETFGTGQGEIKSSVHKDQCLKNSLEMEFVFIPPGSFVMGSPSHEPGRCHDETQHIVSLTRGFYMQTTEVTVAQWREFISETGYRTEAETNGGSYVLTEAHWIKVKEKYWDNPGFRQTERHPITCVSWNDTQMFVAWLSRRENLTYRLPTEAEWEYACRAGAQTPFSYGMCLSTDHANFDGNYPLEGCDEKGEFRGKTVPAAGVHPNTWGLYDMHGNVWEWCQDWWALYPLDPVIDPKGPLSGTDWYPCRIVRGGSWLNSAWRCRSAFRRIYWPEASDNTLGFRIVLEPDASILTRFK